MVILLDMCALYLDYPTVGFHDRLRGYSTNLIGHVVLKVVCFVKLYIQDHPCTYIHKKGH
jgi:hypothetical protein